MKTYAFKKIDAFTGNGSSGNPAGCVYTDIEMPADDMQRIARELKGFVSEVVYCRPVVERGETAFSLLYYSSEREVEFCGHGTIACMYDVIKNDPALYGHEEIRIITRKGNLMVYNKMSTEDSVYITAPVREDIGWRLKAEDTCAALDMPLPSVDTRYPVDIINAGLNTLIVPISSLSCILSIAPDAETLKSFCMQNNIDIVTVWVKETAHQGNFVRTRVFCPKYGYLEDPATGSGNAAAGYYLLGNNIWNGDTINIEQGPALETPNIIKLGAVADEQRRRRVIIGGSAALRIEGSYILHGGAKRS